MESVHTAGEQKKIPKWIDLQQIREREIGPMRTTSVTERVLILRRFEEVEEDPQRFEIRLKTNIKEGGREGSPREIETAGNSVRSRRLSARRSGGRRRAARLRQREIKVDRCIAAAAGKRRRSSIKIASLNMRARVD